MNEMESKKESVKPRQRKKKLIKDVKSLLEFYFSPANITKDKFIQNLLNEDDHISIEVFLKFNKIKNLTSDEKIIKKAVKKSDILELSEDECKIKRKLPLELKENEMECTIYVENLPLSPTHEWLQKVFSLYGTIDYISLPRFNITRRPKGFAFIEFSTPQEAQKAIEAFGGLASLDGTLNPSDLLSIKTFEPQDSIDVSENSDEQKIDQDSKSNKRTADVAFAGEEEGKDENQSKKSKDEAVKEESKKRKKKRKRSKKEKQYEIESVYLRVMAKKDWKVLRNKYLNLQRENMKKLKQLITYNSNNFTQGNEVSESSKKPNFVPDVIVKISLSEPLQNPKEFRIGLTTGRRTICYVDVNSTDKDIFVRFKNSEAAEQFVEEKLWENVELLKGEEEEKYWKKIIESWDECRVKKLSAKSDSALRGREKLITKSFKQKDKKNVKSHTIFDE